MAVQPPLPTLAPSPSRAPGEMTLIRIARGPDGVLGMAMGESPAEFHAALRTIDERLDTGGWVDRAAEVLRGAGKRAWRNSTGHLAVDPVQWGWTAVMA